ncbi:MAG: histone acetyltransferase, partial [archaeon]
MTDPADDPRRIQIEEVRPTQLYLSAAKLASVLEEFEEHDPYGPLPAFEHDGEWYLSDGHTRAFAAYLGGAESIRIERDREVREVYDFDLYLTCIDWCHEADVRTVPDLTGRVLDHETF